MFTLEHKKFALKQWFVMQSITAVRRSFRTRLGVIWHNLPSKSSLRNVIKKFESHGTLQDRRQGEKHLSKDGDVQRVKHLNARKQMISFRAPSKKLALLAYRIRNIRRLRLLKKCYRTKIELRLIESPHKARISSSKEFLVEKAILK